jgi:cytochrome c oxidase subunit 3
MATVSHHQNAPNEEFHLPEPSLWPLFLAVSIGLLPLGFLLTVWSHKGTALLIIGGALVVVCLMGWANQLIKETAALPNVVEDDHWMRLGMKLFLLSEAAIFGAFFAHYYSTRTSASTWPLPGAPHLKTTLPAIATLILMSSSVTMEYAHHAVKAARRKLASWLTLVTIVLGVIFLGFQGYDWGFLKTYDKFTQSSGVTGTLFYVMTGFHGAHVATGLLMLLIVWFRLRLGHFAPERHFSFVAASWYWHFVDVVWIALFFSIYLI